MVPNNTLNFNFKRFSKWFKCEVLYVILNLLQWFEVFYAQNDKVHWTMEVVDLWDKISWWVKFSEKSSQKAKLTPWMKEGIQNLFTQIGSHCVLWIPSMANVLPLLNGNNQGGYGVVCKVQIERFNCTPNTIELVGKTLKMNNKPKTHK